MSIITSTLEPKIQQKLASLAKTIGFNLLDLIRIYSTHYKGRDLDEITENNMPVIEEVELLAMKEEGSDGKIYTSAEELIADLNDDRTET